MGDLPDYFQKVSAIAGVPEDQVLSKWQELCQKVYARLLTWIFTQLDIENDQTKALTSVMEQLGSNDYNENESILDILIKILNQEQMAKVENQMAEMFVDELDRYYTELKSQMSPEQLAVINAYNQVNHE